MEEQFQSIRLVFERDFSLMSAIVMAGLILFVLLPALKNRSVQGARWALLFRSLSAAAVLFIFFEPAIEKQEGLMQKGAIALVVDNSKSMTVKDWPENKTRGQMTASMLSSADEVIERMRADGPVESYSFAGALQELAPDGIGALPFDGASTDFAAMFLELAARYKERPFKGILLITDGQSNPHQDAGRVVKSALKAAGLDRPVHVLNAAGGREFPDISVHLSRSLGIAVGRKTFGLDAVVRAKGLSPRVVPVSCYLDNREVAVKMVTLGPDATEQKVEFEINPDKAGLRVLTVSVPEYTEELLHRNNRDQVPLEVVRDRIRILTVCGRPGWDGRFLRRLLKRDPGNDLVSFFILRDVDDNVVAGREEMSLIPFPVGDIFGRELEGFDLVVFQNFPFSAGLLPIHLENIRNYVRRGGAFLMIGGDRSFGSGSLAATPLAEMLPVDLVFGKDYVSNEPYRMLLTEAGERHAVLDIAARGLSRAQTVRGLPPLSDYHRFRGVKEDAVVLAQVPSRNGSERTPLVALRRYGKGRVMVFASGSSWRWHFAQAGEGGHPQAYRIFWQKAIGWLTGGSEPRLKVRLPERDHAPGEQVSVTFALPEGAGNPEQGGQALYEIADPLAGTTLEQGAAPLTPAGEARVSFTPKSSGIYRVSARVEQGQARDPLSGQTLIEVPGYSRELANPEPDTAFMEELARSTGGRVWPLERASLERAHLPDASRFKIASRTRRSLWNSWPAYTLVVALLAASWWVSRRYGHEP